MADKDTWTMIHRDENDIVTDEFFPLNCNFTLRERDAGDMNYDVPLSLPRMRWSFTGPKRTSYELWHSSMPERPVTSGIHSFINTKRGEEVLHVQGKTWFWYFQNRCYPFNPQLPNAFLGGTAANDQGLAYQAFKDPQEILEDIWDTMSGRPNGDKWGMTIQGTGVGINTGYRLELADSRSLGDMFAELSEVEPGFTYYDNVAREVVIVSPELYHEQARTDPFYSIWTFDRNTPPSDLVDIEFENSGPEMTHILGLGSGTSSRLGRAYGYDQSQEIFGRWDAIKEFPGTLNAEKLVAQTQRAFSKGLYPQHNLPLTLKPDNIPGFWILFKPGWSVWINEDFESNHVHGANVIREMAVTISNQGDTLVDLTLEEINKRGRPGSVQG